jgi:hypothetical protein
MKQKVRSKEEWKKLVNEYRASGKSLRVWCSENGINEKTMSNYTPLYPRLDKPRNAQRSDNEWIELIKKQRASGKSRENWCRENNINHKSMGSAETRYAGQLEEIMRRQDSCNGDGDIIVEIDKSHEIENALNMDSPRWVEVNVKDELPMQQRAVGGGEKEISKITIRCGKLEIEADANYPPTHLESLIVTIVRLTPDQSSTQLGKLVAEC